ncbi:MAG TPA: hypothetical protein VMX57_00600, partial [Planctomycetota bacterium]|nr:hypothetical protein [Planctomycetota bacterium]
YPPGGVDVADDGNLFNTAGDKPGSGEVGDTIDKLQLRAICTELIIRDLNGNEARRVGPYYNPNKVNIQNGAIIDVFGNVLCYLADGRRFTPDPGNPGEILPGRVFERTYTLWSIAEDRTPDIANNNLDDDGNGKVDDPGELENDICSWH